MRFILLCALAGFLWNNNFEFHFEMKDRAKPRPARIDTLTIAGQPVLAGRGDFLTAATDRAALEEIIYRTEPDILVQIGGQEDESRGLATATRIHYAYMPQYDRRTYKEYASENRTLFHRLE